MPKKDADDDTAAPELTTDKFTDAGTHTVRVTGIAGDGKANFTVTGGKDITSTLVIVPHKVNITTAAASHVYGDALANGELSYDISGNENVYDVADFITLQVQDGTGADMFATANNRATVGGSYRTVPLLSGDGSANYELVYAPSDLASFTVIKRNIAVTVKSSDGGSLATSKYGDDIMIANGELASDIYDVASDNGTGDALADAVKDVLVFSTDATSASPISTDTVKYYVSCVLTAAASVNYDLTFASDTYEYVIAPATISGVTAAAYVGVYDAAEHALFVFEAADGATKTVRRFRIITRKRRTPNTSRLPHRPCAMFTTKRAAHTILKLRRTITKIFIWTASIPSAFLKRRSTLRSILPYSSARKPLTARTT